MKMRDRLEYALAWGLIAAAVAAGVLALRSATSDALPAPQPAAVTSSALQAHPSEDVRQIGELAFLGAVRLQAPLAEFGGLSGLAAGAEGQFLAVTDAGNWLVFRAVETAERLNGVSEARMAPILGADGRAAATKADGDAESLACDALLIVCQVGFEQQHRVVHFSGAPLDARAVRDERLTAMIGWPLNGGTESLALLPGGGRVIISEDALRADGSLQALLTTGRITRDFGIPRVAGFRPTDAVALDATHLIVLHRRFTPADRGSALTLVDLAPVLAGGDAATARLLARWQPPLVHDNFEGLALVARGGRRFLYLVSDDNFNAAQATILMKLELPALNPPLNPVPPASSPPA
jgi:hypothetical protein